MKYTISKKFTMRVERSPRVLELAESFGIGLEEREFVIYDNLELEIDQGDIIYITGQSGSGKSLLLKELAKKMFDQRLRTANIDAVNYDQKPLIDQIGDTSNEAQRIFSAVGLCDANLWIRSPDQLSDGERYRFRLAKLIQSSARVWVADEFGAVLDRTTAINVAYSMQKIVREHGVTLMVATTHKDLKDALGPTIYIDKRFGKRISIEVNR